MSKAKVVYKERKKKPALPNRKNSAKTAQEELAERQDTAERTAIVYRQMLPGLLEKLNQIEDPRAPKKITHKMTVLLIYGILLFVYQIGSRREANRKMSDAIFFENLNGIFPELETLPHADTLARLLERINVPEIQECMIELIKDLIRRKKFRNYLIRKHYLIAIDGTQKYYRDYQWDEKCLERHVGGEARIPQFYVYVLEAVLILDNGITLPLMSVFLKNQDYIEGVTKQDCERKAFQRMAGKLKKSFPRTRIAVVVDGLYACGPIIHTCRTNGWDYMIVLKEDCLKDVWHEATELMRIDPENSLEVIWGDRRQVYKWANDIEYEYGKNRRNKEILNVVICQETWWANHNENTKNIEEKNTRYAWLSSKRLNEKNVFERCTKMGRYRWKIENNILAEKHQGYEYEHSYSNNWNAMEGFHYLMKIGRLLNTLALNSVLLANKVKELGIRGFISYLKLVCSGSLLDKVKIENACEGKQQWKLEPAI